MKIKRDLKGQPYIEWEQGAGHFKRAWIQRNSGKTEMTDKEGLADAAPKIASAMVEIVRQHHASGPLLRKFYADTLHHMVRYLERFIVPRVSEDAQEQATARGLGDLRQFNWHHQPKKMNDAGRKFFHWEHNPPVNDLVREILHLSAPTAPAIAAILSKACVVWITKAQNGRLPSHGRPDPEAAYVAAGIKLLPE